MTTIGIVRAAALAALVLSVGFSFAVAKDARVNHYSSIHETPSAGSPRVNFVNTGVTVRVLECRTTRCRIALPGADGWIRKSFLDL